jgi:integrase
VFEGHVHHAIKGGVAVKNPICKSGAKALSEDNEQTRVLSYDEQARYLAVATPMLRDVATLMLETGMRPEEVYRIQPENANLAGGFLFNPLGKTKAARRRVSLTTAARSVLTRRMAGLETPYLFPCDTDAARHVPKVNNAHDRAVRDSKVARFRLYDLRHTWATRAAESGIDLVTLAWPFQDSDGPAVCPSIPRASGAICGASGTIQRGPTDGGSIARAGRGGRDDSVRKRQPPATVAF